MTACPCRQKDSQVHHAKRWMNIRSWGNDRGNRWYLNYAFASLSLRSPYRLLSMSSKQRTSKNISISNLQLLFTIWGPCAKISHTRWRPWNPVTWCCATYIANSFEEEKCESVFASLCPQLIVNIGTVSPQRMRSHVEEIIIRYPATWKDARVSTERLYYVWSRHHNHSLAIHLLCPSCTYRTVLRISVMWEIADKGAYCSTTAKRATSLDFSTTLVSRAFSCC